MIAPEETALYLETVISTIKHELLPDLQSDHARHSADNLLLLLNRVVGQLGRGESIAEARLGTWQCLSHAIGGTADRNDGQPMVERLESILSDAQHMLQASGPDGMCAKPWFRDAARASADLMEALESATIFSIEVEQRTGVLPDAEDLRRRLEDYLTARFGDAAPPTVRSVRFLAGGSTKLTALADLGPNQTFPDNVVLRMDLPASITGISVTTEYPIQKRVAHLGMLTPRPLLFEEDPSFLGGPFVLMEAIAGSTSAGKAMAEERRSHARRVDADFGKELARQVARLHAATLQSTPSEQQSRAVADAIQDAHRQWLNEPRPRNSLVTDLCFAWLRENPLPPGRPLTLVHGDFSMQNLMVRDGKLTGIIDWELAHDGDPAEDLAYCRMLFDDVVDWDDFVETYIVAGGPAAACDPHAVAYASIWMFLKLGAMVQNVRNNFAGGVRRDSLNAQIATQGVDRMLLYQARALLIALDR